MIYIASPYSHPEEHVRAQRYHLALEYTVHCMQKGEAVFSPIVYGHHCVKLGAGTDHLYWDLLNNHILLACCAMRVLMLDGWSESLGIRDEIDWAANNGMPVTYVSPIRTEVKVTSAYENL